MARIDDSVIVDYKPWLGCTPVAVTLNRSIYVILASINSKQDIKTWPHLIAENKWILTCID